MELQKTTLWGGVEQAEGGVNVNLIIFHIVLAHGDTGHRVRLHAGGIVHSSVVCMFDHDG